jgi:ATP-dependent exoDNAse (exonuclease V) alpha subunit
MESGESVTVPTGWAADHLDYGYALTVHKAQGLTTRTALVYGTDALDQQAGYVALSRGRVDNHLYTSAASLSRDEPDLDVARFQILDREPPAGPRRTHRSSRSCTPPRSRVEPATRRR